MTIKRTISRAFVIATVPAAMLMGGSPALAGEDAEKNHNHWVCDEFHGDWADHDDWEKWKDEHCDDNGDKNDHNGKRADHDNNDHDDGDHDDGKRDHHDDGKNDHNGDHDRK
jgi:hypothetical protein